MKVGIVGSRGFSDYKFLEYILDRVFKERGMPTRVVSGGAIGADTFAARYARDHKIPVSVFYPDWDRGRQAGFDRNQVIVNHSDYLIAFWDGESYGTGDTMGRARRKGIEVICINYKTLPGINQG
jgi:hypothetical protein